MSKILDTTLRDGSYVTNFQFNLRDTALIASKLDQAGVHFIEVGHGLGMNAGTRKEMQSHYPDEAYLEVCQKAVRKNQWGMFFIPGIGRLEDLDLGARYGMNFIRIGIDVDRVDDSEPYIKKAKQLGLYVAVNFMKSYAFSHEILGLSAKKAANFGADIVVIVDSAGGMFPDEITPYFDAIRLHSDVDIGFHGHNNMGLGIANGIHAANLGCAVVDTSIRGLGRSAGNTNTEMFLFAMKRRGFDLNINIDNILDLADNIIDPLLSSYRQVDSIGIICGFAQFHSGFLDRINYFASKYQVSPGDLIIGVSKRDKVNVSEELVETVALELAGSKLEGKSKADKHLDFSAQSIVFSGDLAEDASRMARQIHSEAARLNRTSIFNIVQSFRPDSVSAVSSVIHQGSFFTVGSAEVADVRAALIVADAVDSFVDYVLVDIDNKTSQSEGVVRELTEKSWKSGKLYYSDINVWSDSVATLVTEITASRGVEQNIRIIGVNILSDYLRVKLGRTGRIRVVDDDLSADNDIVIYCESAEGRLPSNIKKSRPLIIDAIVGSLSEHEVKELTDLGLKVIRVDMHPHIESTVKNLFAVAKKVANLDMETKRIEGIDIAPIGVVAPRDTVIVDSASQPSKVYGIADGSGFILPESQLTPDQKRKLARIELSVYC